MTAQYTLAVDPPPPVLELQDRLKVQWPHIIAARARSRDRLDELQRTLYPLVPQDTTCVVFGSLARLELTAGSDVDWTLLVDGCANAEHWVIADRIEGRLREMGLREPTKGGAFGHLTFSHDLIHKIGGDDDTNRNTTQRLLLLLESAPLGRPEAYDRVVRGVLARYIEEDLAGLGDTPYRVPRFLQNDVVRYWRTMTVDFAHKRRTRATGWALRTAKLRMSRKLIYASGLLNCYSCTFFHESQRRQGPFRDENHVIGHLEGLVRSTPLDTVAGFVLDYFGELSGSAARLFEAYDEFLGLLNEEAWRTHLKELRPEDANGDPVYCAMRELGTRFHNALTEIFFDCDTPVRALTRRYGVF